MSINYNTDAKQHFIQKYLGLSGHSIPIPVQMAKNAEVKQCFENVSGLVELNSGKARAQMCWIVYSHDEILAMANIALRTPGILSPGMRPYFPAKGEFMAELHCIIFNLITKTYHDITPDAHGKTIRHIVFEPRITLKELQAYEYGRFERFSVTQGICNISNKQPELWSPSNRISSIWDLIKHVTN